MFDRYPISVGRDPVKILALAMNVISAVMFPISVGIVPVM